MTNQLVGFVIFTCAKILNTDFLFQIPSAHEPAMKSQSQRISAGNRGSIGSNNAGSKDRFSGRNAPDNCQVFIGNLPNGLGEKQVQDVFSSECFEAMFYTHRVIIDGFSLAPTLAV